MSGKKPVIDHEGADAFARVACGLVALGAIEARQETAEEANRLVAEAYLDLAAQVESLKLEVAAYKVVHKEACDLAEPWRYAPDALPGDSIIEVMARRAKAYEALVVKLQERLSFNGCDCDCDHSASEHEEGCERCFACRIEQTIEETKPEMK